MRGACDIRRNRSLRSFVRLAISVQGQGHIYAHGKQAVSCAPDIPVYGRICMLFIQRPAVRGWIRGRVIIRVACLVLFYKLYAGRGIKSIFIPVIAVTIRSTRHVFQFHHAVMQLWHHHAGARKANISADKRLVCVHHAGVVFQQKRKKLLDRHVFGCIWRNRAVVEVGQLSLAKDFLTQHKILLMAHGPALPDAHTVLFYGDGRAHFLQR